MGRLKGDHGVGRYSHGCRCEVCTAAKRSYMKDRRDQASRQRELAEADGRGRHYVHGITHGYSGYQNHHCRCVTCCDAKSGADRKRPSRGREVA